MKKNRLVRTARSNSFLLAIFILGVCAVAPQLTSAGDVPDRGSFADIYRNRALDYEKAGELYKALQMWEIVSSFLPGDREIIQKIDTLLKEANTAAENHFKKGLAYYGRGSTPSARKEFLLTLIYNPDHADALDYLKNKLAGDDFIQYEVRKSDTLQTIAQRIYNDPQKTFLISSFNNLNDNVRLTPGMSLRLPVIELSVPKQTSGEYDWKPTEIEEVPVKTVDTAGLLAKAKNLFKAKKYQEALLTLDSVLEHDKMNSVALDLANASNYQMGKIMSEGKNYKEALKYFSRVDSNYQDIKDARVLTQNRLAEVHYNTGVKFFVNDQLEKAIVEWEEALSLNPKHLRARKDIENAQNLLKKLQELK
jgi:tetratricopeptide (TPR) repeat protein